MLAHGRIAGGLMLALALMRAATAFALTACSEADIVGKEPGCPAGDGVCVIESSFQGGDDCICNFDFGTRPVVLRGQIRCGEWLDLSSGALTLEPGSLLRAAEVTLDAHGDVWLQRQDRYTRGLIDTSGESHWIFIQTTGSLRIDGELIADASAAGKWRGIEIVADAGIAVSTVGIVSCSDIATGEYEESSEVRLESQGPIVLDGTMRMLGAGYEGIVDVTSYESSVSIGGRVRLDGWFARTDGGGLYVSAPLGITLSGKVTTVAGPVTLGDGSYWSGAVDLDGPSVVTGEIITDGVLYGSAGEIGIGADNVPSVVSGRLSARSHRLHLDTASIDVDGSRIELSGDIDIANGAQVNIRGQEVYLGGHVTGHSLAGSDESERFTGIFIEAQQTYIDADIDFSAIGCENGECPDPWSFEVGADLVQLSPSTSIVTGGRIGGEVDLYAYEHLQMAGDVDGRGDLEDGTVKLHGDVSCSITGSALPDPILTGACSPSFTPPPTPSPTATPTGPSPPTSTPVPATPTATASQTASSPTPTLPVCPGDCDDSGALDATDLVRILDVVAFCPDSISTCEFFSPADACPAADLNRDAVISAGELTRIIAGMTSASGCP